MTLPFAPLRLFLRTVAYVRRAYRPADEAHLGEEENQMRKSFKRLSLSRETLGQLDAAFTRQAAGGQTLTCVKGSHCCPVPTDANCGSMTHCEGSVCCSHVFVGCGSALSQCATICIPCQTGPACIG